AAGRRCRRWSTGRPRPPGHGPVPARTAAAAPAAPARTAPARPCAARSARPPPRLTRYLAMQDISKMLPDAEWPISSNTALHPFVAPFCHFFRQRPMARLPASLTSAGYGGCLARPAGAGAPLGCGAGYPAHMATLEEPERRVEQPAAAVRHTVSAKLCRLAP